MRVTFKVVEGPHLGAEFTFDEYASFVVGRHRKTQFRLSLKDPFLSRLHFYIDVAPPVCALVDLHSTNKTYVNGEQVHSRVELADGDRIKAGTTILRVSIKDADEATSPPPPLDPGSVPVLPRYRIERLIGRGTTGAVYLAVDNRDGSRVALKTVVSVASGPLVSADRFEREALILKRLDHPNIVALYDAGRTAEWLYLAMEYVPGVDAQRFAEERGGTLPVREAVDVVSQALDGLACAHAAEVVHRDFKPANILVSRATGRIVAKLGDFGTARLYNKTSLSTLTKTNTFLGTLGYVPPEQIRDSRSVTPASDVYSAGATLFHLLTGEWPYDFPNLIADCFSMILNTRPRPIRTVRPEVPGALAQAVDRALAHKLEDRFHDAVDMREALEPWVRRNLR